MSLVLILFLASNADVVGVWTRVPVPRTSVETRTIKNREQSQPGSKTAECTLDLEQLNARLKGQKGYWFSET